MDWRIHNFAKNARLKDFTVLVVEDEIMARHALAALLDAKGYLVLAAESGEKALELLRKSRRVMVALVDYSLPGMNGLSLIQRLRALDGEIVPILMTADDDDEIISRAYNDSVTYMRKPIDIGRVFELLSKQTAVHM